MFLCNFCMAFAAINFLKNLQISHKQSIKLSTKTNIYIYISFLNCINEFKPFTIYHMKNTIKKFINNNSADCKIVRLIQTKLAFRFIEKYPVFFFKFQFAPVKSCSESIRLFISTLPKSICVSKNVQFSVKEYQEKKNVQAMRKYVN